MHSPLLENLGWITNRDWLGCRARHFTSSLLLRQSYCRFVEARSSGWRVGRCPVPFWSPLQQTPLSIGEVFHERKGRRLLSRSRLTHLVKTLINRLLWGDLTTMIHSQREHRKLKIHEKEWIQRVYLPGTFFHAVCLKYLQEIVDVVVTLTFRSWLHPI